MAAATIALAGKEHQTIMSRFGCHALSLFDPVILVTLYAMGPVDAGRLVLRR